MYANNLPTRSSILYMKIGFPASDIFGATSYMSPSLIDKKYLFNCEMEFVYYGTNRNIIILLKSNIKTS